jgi:hypothetical protein
MARMPTLLLAALLDSPALWHAFVKHDMDPVAALTRYLIAVVVAAVMLAMLRGLANGYLREAPVPADRPGAEPEPAEGEVIPPARRSTD